MSDQAFVKAFSRRRPSQGSAPQNPAPLSQVTSDQESQDAVVTDAAMPDAAVPEAVHQATAPHSRSEPGSLQLDQSVASTARIWVDPIEDQIARADLAINDAPRPHLGTAGPIVPTDRKPTAATGVPEADLDLPAPESTTPGATTPGATTPESTTPEKRTMSQSGDENLPFAPEVVDPLQHIHTAYATAYADATILAEIGHVDAQGLAEVEEPITAVPTTQPTEPEPVTEACPPSPTESEYKQSASESTADQESYAESVAAESISDLGHGSQSRATLFGDAGMSTPVQEVFQAPIDDISEPPMPTVPPAPESVDPLTVESTHSENESRQFEPTTFAPFQAVWEVDVFDVPTPVADLFFEGTLFQQIAERMSEAVGSGLSSVLVTSTKAGEGRSSVAIGIAMAAAAAGIRVALVDADTDDPTLADDLRLDLQYGWVDTVRGGLPIKEVAVQAVEDGVTLIPLMPPSGRNAATAFEVVQLVELLKNKFELVIIDGPTSQSANIHQCASIVDSAIIVRDMVRTDTLAINEFSYRLRESGVQGVGIVENFT